MKIVTEVGYWSPRTATIDWCEENYVISHYIAEFWNTVSNLLMIVFPLVFLFSSRHWRLDVAVRLCFFSLMVVGFGSWMFHMTLLYPAQLMDELPMIWCTCVLLYTVYKVEGSIDKRKTTFLVLYSSIFTVMYLFFPMPNIQHTCYGILVIYTTIKSIMLTRKHQCSTRIMFTSAFIYALGFLVWNIDNKFCPHLRTMRSSATLNPLTQMHAWWHIFSGFGSYYYLIFLTHFSMTQRRENPRCSLYAGIVPIVRPRCSQGKVVVH